jgi:hypothetical protein
MLQITVLKILKMQGKRSDDPEVQKFLKLILDECEVEQCWRNRADTTSQAIAVIKDYDFPNKSEMLAASRRFLKLKASENGPNRINWGLGTSTSYTIMNMVESNFLEDSDLQLLTAKAVNWLVDKQQLDGWWIDEIPPYGGEQNIISPDYYTGAIVRGIIAYNCTINPDFPLEVMWMMNKDHKNNQQTKINEIIELHNQQISEHRKQTNRLISDKNRLSRNIRYSVFGIFTLSLILSFVAFWFFRSQIANYSTLITAVWGVFATIMTAAGTVLTAVYLIQQWRERSRNNKAKDHII